MARRNRKMTFEEWMEKEAQLCEFDEGGSPEIYSKLGEKVLKEEMRKEENKLHARRLKYHLRKMNRRASMGKTSKTSHQVINYKGMQYTPEGELGVVYLFSKLQRKLGYLKCYPTERYFS